MDRLLTEREFDEAWYRAEHDTVLDRKAAILKAQDAKTANYYETVIIPQKVKEAEKKLLEYLKADAKYQGGGHVSVGRNKLESMLKLLEAK
jgi:hypothetical protein